MRNLEASGKSKFSNQERSCRFFETAGPSIAAARSLNFSRTVGGSVPNENRNTFRFLNLLKMNGFVVNGLTREICSKVDQALSCHEKF